MRTKERDPRGRSLECSSCLRSMLDDLNGVLKCRDCDSFEWHPMMPVLNKDHNKVLKKRVTCTWCGLQKLYLHGDLDGAKIYRCHVCGYSVVTNRALPANRKIIAAKMKSHEVNGR